MWVSLPTSLRDSRKLSISSTSSADEAAEAEAAGTETDTAGAEAGAETETAAGTGVGTETAGVGAETETVAVGAGTETETDGAGVETETAGTGAETAAAGAEGAVAETDTAAEGAGAETDTAGVETETVGAGAETDTEGVEGLSLEAVVAAAVAVTAETAELRVTAGTVDDSAATTGAAAEGGATLKEGAVKVGATVTEGEEGATVTEGAGADTEPEKASDSGGEGVVGAMGEEVEASGDKMEKLGAEAAKFREVDVLVSTDTSVLARGEEASEVEGVFSSELRLDVKSRVFTGLAGGATAAAGAGMALGRVAETTEGFLSIGILLVTFASAAGAGAVAAVDAISAVDEAAGGVIFEVRGAGLTAGVPRAGLVATPRADAGTVTEAPTAALVLFSVGFFFSGTFVRAETGPVGGVGPTDFRPVGGLISLPLGGAFFSESDVLRVGEDKSLVSNLGMLGFLR